MELGLSGHIHQNKYKKMTMRMETTTGDLEMEDEVEADYEDMKT